MKKFIDDFKNLIEQADRVEQENKALFGLTRKLNTTMLRYFNNGEVQEFSNRFSKKKAKNEKPMQSVSMAALIKGQEAKKKQKRIEEAKKRVAADNTPDNEEERLVELSMKTAEEIIDDFGSVLKFREYTSNKFGVDYGKASKDETVLKKFAEFVEAKFNGSKSEEQ